MMSDSEKLWPVHLDEHGRARMVDVGQKPSTRRRAVAAARLHMKASTLHLLLSNDLPKGDVLAVARVAGIMAAKRTPELIPLCHTVPLTSVEVHFKWNEPYASSADQHEAVLEIMATVETVNRTGVEMEALVAVSLAALTIYDMCKAVDQQMRIEATRLIEKSGGRSGHFVATEYVGSENVQADQKEAGQ